MLEAVWYAGIVGSRARVTWTFFPRKLNLLNVWQKLENFHRIFKFSFPLHLTALINFFAFDTRR